MTQSPTEDQQQVLQNSSRIRVVRAIPGSGKTWLVAELIRRELGIWPNLARGIAALSFTRVGGEEIRQAVGHDLDHPHFVGTIDSFLFRYVVRPFLRQCVPGIKPPRLLPGDLGADLWQNYGPQLTTLAGIGSKRFNIFECLFIRESDAGEPILACKPHPMQPIAELSGQLLSAVFGEKKTVWRRKGLLTHSDVAYLASRILVHPILGLAVRTAIINRFPLIIVDELQDTGFFLGKCIRTLLSYSDSRGVLVGDPDQAIYEFNGARPDLFEQFREIDGAHELTLSTTRRFGTAIAEAATHLKDSGGRLIPAVGIGGRAFMLRYQSLQDEIPPLYQSVLSRTPTLNIMIIARQMVTVNALNGRHVNPANLIKLGSPALSSLQRAVTLFGQGQVQKARASSKACIDRIVFEHEGVNEEDLNGKGIELQAWWSLAGKILLRCASLSREGSIFEWQTRAAGVVSDEFAASGMLSLVGIIIPRPTRRDGYEKDCLLFFPIYGQDRFKSSNCRAQTVHAVKGQTHDLTFFVCPPSPASKCPSKTWWSSNEKDREERRIAYVAVTRARGDLIVCVSQENYQRFESTRPEFLACFQSVTPQEFLTVY